MGAGEASSPNLIRMGYDAGIKLFFSATYYGEGNNERLVGEALKGLPRDSFIVGTAGIPQGFNPREGTPPKDLTAESYMQTVEESLGRFGLEHVDILLLPYADKKELVLFEPILKAMTELKKQGKIRFTGIALHNPGGEGLRAAADSGVYDVAMPAYNHKTKELEAVNGALAYAAKAGMGIVAMKTTAGAARDKDRTRPMNITAALKWVLQNENVSSIVSGMSSEEEMRMNLEMIKEPEADGRGAAGPRPGGGEAGGGALLPAVPDMPPPMPEQPGYSHADAQLHVRLRVPERRPGPAHAQHGRRLPRFLRRVRRLPRRLRLRLRRQGPCPGHRPAEGRPVRFHQGVRVQPGPAGGSVQSRKRLLGLTLRKVFNAPWISFDHCFLSEPGFSRCLVSREASSLRSFR